MTHFGYTLMTEQSGPKELVRYAVAAERRRLRLRGLQRPLLPWLTAQGHAPYAWTVLGAVAQATERVELMTYVTCPTMRYHPAVVAQKAATLQLLADGRFTLGPRAAARTSTSTSSARAGPRRGRARRCSPRPSRSSASCTPASSSTYHGDYFDVDSARIWDLPERRRSRSPSPSAASASVDDASRPLADHLIAVEPDADLVDAWNAADGAPRDRQRRRAIGQIPICWDPDEDDGA